MTRTYWPPSAAAVVALRRGFVALKSVTNAMLESHSPLPPVGQPTWPTRTWDVLRSDCGGRQDEIPYFRNETPSAVNKLCKSGSYVFKGHFVCLFNRMRMASSRRAGCEGAGKVKVLLLDGGGEFTCGEHKIRSCYTDCDSRPISIFYMHQIL